MNKTFIIIGIIALVAAAAFFILIRIGSSPISRETALKSFDALIRNDVKSSKDITGATVLVHSDRMAIDTMVSYERDSAGNVTTGSGDTPFHIASIGKTFTAVVIAQLQESGALDFNDPASRYLDAGALDGLFVFEGVDHQSEVTVGRLLGHMSGVADYFEDPVKEGSTIADLILAEPDHLWTPDELIAFSRDRQTCVGKPGDVYHYSDTGYILLGRIIEKVTGKSFDENLKTRIFEPLRMDDSYLMFYSEPKNLPAKPIAKILFRGVEVSGFKSLSVDWAGGGIVSTVGDLLKFHKALQGGDLISTETLAVMSVFDHKFRTGIYYGLGLMQFRFGEFFPLLSAYPKMTGHMGILSTFMFYDEVHDAYVIMNCGSDAHVQKSVQNIITIVGTLMRVK